MSKNDKVNEVWIEVKLPKHDIKTTNFLRFNNRIFVRKDVLQQLKKEAKSKKDDSLCF